MSNVLITKFPVTAPDGTEYRVTVCEGYTPLFGRDAAVTLEIPVKRRKFKHVYSKTFRGIVDYDTSDPDYIELASRTLVEHLESVRKKAEAVASRQAAVERFNAWDGRVSGL
ncbi:hypothetical protein BJP50_18675 [Paenibacillus odorifer]|nr:hypothetical protein BJP50_18675 [Paenibacillus odorifer]